jgi:hypothetical protein
MMIAIRGERLAMRFLLITAQLCTCQKRDSIDNGTKIGDCTGNSPRFFA